MKTENYVFSKQYKPKWKYKPDYGVREIKYVVLTILFSLSIWMLFYVLGVGVMK